MNEPQVIHEEPVKHRSRSSLLFPILLVGAGVIFLLDNLGLLGRDAWSTLISLWPLLLIAAGLDGIWKREGMAGAALALGSGVVLLLANFGYLSFNPWATLLRLWPLFLVAIGIDLMLGRRSLAASLAAFVLMLAILAAALWFFGVRTGRQGGAAVQGAQVGQALGAVTEALVVIQAGAGEVRLDALDTPGNLVQGTVPQERSQQISQEYAEEGGRAVYTLRSSGATMFFPGPDQQSIWDLGLNSEVPMEVQLDLGAGDLELDLGEVALQSLDVDLGVGEATVTLPYAGRYTGRLNLAIGSVTILVPHDLGVRIEENAALVSVNVPDGYRQDGGVFTSPNYQSADNRVDLDLGMAIGSINVKER